MKWWYTTVYRGDNQPILFDGSTDFVECSQGMCWNNALIDCIQSWLYLRHFEEVSAAVAKWPKWKRERRFTKS